VQLRQLVCLPVPPMGSCMKDVVKLVYHTTGSLPVTHTLKHRMVPHQPVKYGGKSTMKPSKGSIATNF